MSRSGVANRQCRSTDSNQEKSLTAPQPFSIHKLATSEKKQNIPFMIPVLIQYFKHMFWYITIQTAFYSVPIKN